MNFISISFPSKKEKPLTMSYLKLFIFFRISYVLTRILGPNELATIMVYKLNVGELSCTRLLVCWLCRLSKILNIEPYGNRIFHLTRPWSQLARQNGTSNGTY